MSTFTTREIHRSTLTALTGAFGPGAEFGKAFHWELIPPAGRETPVSVSMRSHDQDTTQVWIYDPYSRTSGDAITLVHIRTEDSIEPLVAQIRLAVASGGA